MGFGEKGIFFVFRSCLFFCSINPLLQYSITPCFYDSQELTLCLKKTVLKNPSIMKSWGWSWGPWGYLILLALISHHPADPSFSSPQMGDLPIKNWVGKIGSYSSTFLFESLGLASFWLSFIFFQLALFSFRKDSLPSPVLAGHRISFC